MRHLITRIFAMISLFFIITSAYALSPEGNWITIDDKTQKPRGIMQLWIDNGILYGKVLKIFPQPGDKGKCVKCSGSLKDKPIVGLTILSGMKNTGNNVWSGGRILDPQGGNSYNCIITVIDEGKKLKVRGYLGFSIFGRTQYWVKET